MGRKTRFLIKTRIPRMKNTKREGGARLGSPDRWMGFHAQMAIEMVFHPWAAAGIRGTDLVAFTYRPGVE